MTSLRKLRRRLRAWGRYYARYYARYEHHGRIVVSNPGWIRIAAREYDERQWRKYHRRGCDGWCRTKPCKPPR